MATKKTPVRIRFTAKALHELAHGATVYDDRVPSLGLRVSPKGRRTFFVLGKAGERATIGSFPNIAVESARTLARDINAQLAAGESPRKRRLEEKRKTAAELTWFDVWQDYRVNRERRRAGADSSTLEHQWKKYLSRWKDRKLSEITREDVRPFILNLRKRAPVAANRVHRQGKAMFNHAVTELEWDGDNPFAFTQLSEKDRGRDRSVSRAELQRLFAALPDLENQAIADLLRMAVYTGQRIGNVRTMRYEDIDVDEGVWFIRKTKQGKPHRAVLATAALDLIEQRRASGSEWVFPGRRIKQPLAAGGYKKAWTTVLRIAEITDLTVHDLRSVHATQSLEAGLVGQIQRQLGHASPDMTQRYLRPGVGAQRLMMDAALAGLDDSD